MLLAAIDDNGGKINMIKVDKKRMKKLKKINIPIA